MTEVKAIVLPKPIVSQAPLVSLSQPQSWQFYQQPSFYGTCTAVTGAGIVSNNCLPGTTPVATSGNGCYCYDPATQWAGCGNTANGVCRLNPFTPEIIVSTPVPETVVPSSFPVFVPTFQPWRRPFYNPRRCPPGLLC